MQFHPIHISLGLEILNSQDFMICPKYSELTNEISEYEWDNILKDINEKSASGNSGIGYLVIKRLPPRLQNLIRETYNLMLISGHGNFPRLSPFRNQKNLITTWPTLDQ
ncbi:hypothetical protein RhiirA5_356504 [Rhizophagus irregularis]|nr:hypothetical protein RirG_151710 [Rhizophagus irregularis DAOM 197198w]PKC09609.1 hypothetical protein RhiirA5_356504 [Rhizophagus irregularis]GET59143.1 hypothetical protein GLOIN_2v1771600 [Rhizophagus irregularis DAOM 181602=DAOM 197198]PKK64573.1 hypothetical protein RhiirC2_756502 [Rhizophagus irregularis]PKY18538.1 hypothetical protein RhiirB3_405705 [Rhizophagus irregularis]